MHLIDRSALLVNPKIGASWEGFALESVIRHLNVDAQDCYFWATHGKVELDLLIAKGTERIGFEFKYSKTPALTKSMQIAMDDLSLKNLTVIYPGDKKVRLTKDIICLGLKDFLT